jgi:hypothetical protein
MRAGAVAVWLLATGCGGSLGSIQGFDLGRVKGAGWAKQLDDTIAVTASDVDASCDPLASLEADPDATWTLWISSTDSAGYHTDLDAVATIALNDGLLDNERDGSGTIRVDNAGDALQVAIDLDFGDDRLKGSFKADACPSPTSTDATTAP